MFLYRAIAFGNSLGYVFSTRVLGIWGVIFGISTGKLRKAVAYCIVLISHDWSIFDVSLYSLYVFLLCQSVLFFMSLAVGSVVLQYKAIINIIIVPYLFQDWALC